MSEATIHSDEPSGEDSLNRNQYAEAFARLGETCDTPMVVGLYGDWGMGKTTLMKLIQEKLDPDRTRTIWFDPWQYQFDDNPALALLHTVVETLEMKNPEEAKKILTVIEGTFSSVPLKDADASGKRFEEERIQIRSERLRLREHLQKLIETAQGNDKKRIVFFLDDLDRCTPVNVLSLLESLKLYLNFRNCMFFIGADRRALENSVRHHYKNIELSETGYLDKIVQLHFTIPPIDPDYMAEFIKPLLMKELEPCYELLVRAPGDNPRVIKRIINTLTLNHQLADSLSIPDYDPKILALLLLIQERKPGLFRIIARQPQLLQKLKLKKEETRHLREEFLTGDERLQEILELTTAPDENLLRKYIYLIEAPGAGDGATNNTLIHLHSILSEHSRWIKSNSKDGQKADLSGADLRYAKLDHANLEQAGMRDVSLIGANMKHANLSGVSLDHANLSDASLDRANLSGTNLGQASLRNVSLVGASLEHANLSGARLSGANLSDANLSGADLRGAILDGVNLAAALNITKDQLKAARINESTTVPHHFDVSAPE